MNKKTRILAISKTLGLTHIGSNLSVLPVLEEIYAQKKPGDKVILDCGHSHLAHLLCMEEADPIVAIYANPAMKTANRWPERMIEKYGIHCDKNICDTSSGSLGHGIGIGIGYAIAERKKKVYVVVSDGSMMEGSNWEALRIRQELRLENLIIYTNFNGCSAVADIDTNLLVKRMGAFGPNIRFRYTKNGLGKENHVQDHYVTV